MAWAASSSGADMGRLAGPRRGGLTAWRGVASRHGRGEGYQRDAASEHAGGGDHGREHGRALVASRGEALADEGAEY